MKHIKLYESFEDEVDPSMRDLFGLTNSFSITYPEATYYGDKEMEYCEIKGPSENFDAAEEIVDEINDEIKRTIDNMRSDGENINEFVIDDIFSEKGYDDRLSAIGYHVYYNGKKYVST